MNFSTSLLLTLAFVAGVFALVSLASAWGLIRGEARREDAVAEFALRPGTDIARRIVEALAARGIRVQGMGPLLVVDARDYRLRIAITSHGIECLHTPRWRVRQEPGFTAAEVRQVIRATLESDPAVVDLEWRDS